MTLYAKLAAIGTVLACLASCSSPASFGDGGEGGSHFQIGRTAFPDVSSLGAGIATLVSETHSDATSGLSKLTWEGYFGAVAGSYYTASDQLQVALYGLSSLGTPTYNKLPLPLAAERLLVQLGLPAAQFRPARVENWGESTTVTLTQYHRGCRVLGAQLMVTAEPNGQSPVASVYFSVTGAYAADLIVADSTEPPDEVRQFLHYMAPERVGYLEPVVGWDNTDEAWAVLWQTHDWEFRELETVIDEGGLGSYELVLNSRGKTIRRIPRTKYVLGANGLEPLSDLAAVTSRGAFAGVDGVLHEFEFQFDGGKRLLRGSGLPGGSPLTCHTATDLKSLPGVQVVDPPAWNPCEITAYGVSHSLWEVLANLVPELARRTTKLPLAVGARANGMPWTNAANVPLPGSRDYCIVYGEEMDAAGNTRTIACRKEVVAHELVHWLMRDLGRLTMSGDAEALCESLADLIGVHLVSLQQKTPTVWHFAPGCAEKAMDRDLTVYPKLRRGDCCHSKGRAFSKFVYMTLSLVSSDAKRLQLLLRLLQRCGEDTSFPEAVRLFEAVLRTSGSGRLGLDQGEVRTALQSLQAERTQLQQVLSRRD